MRCVRLRRGSSAGSCRYPVLESRRRESVSGPAPCFPAAPRAREPLARGSPAAHAQRAGASLSFSVAVATGGSRCPLSWRASAGMEPLDELDLLLLEEDGGAVAVPRVDL